MVNVSHLLISLRMQVIAFILGKAWAKVLPKADKGRFWALLNPCDFNIKEHVAICESRKQHCCAQTSRYLTSRSFSDHVVNGF